MTKYQGQIGDGKIPNKYWVFQYDQKYQMEDGCLEVITEDTETKNSFLGEFKTFKEAMQCVDNTAFLPNVIVEDRLSGQVFEQLCVVCPCCKKEDYENHEDIRYTQKRLAELGIMFQ